MKLTFILVLLSITCFAQEDKKVMAAIYTLFDGMHKGDSAMAHSAFYPGAKMYRATTDSKTGQPVLRQSDLKNFIAAVGTPHKEVWTELVWSPKIEIDGNLAQVWVPFAFYRDKTFSHCGVDAFQLFKEPSGNWKIFYLADTRQKEGCKVPKEESEKLK